jgi:uncharacterized protein (DUF433 family)
MNAKSDRITMNPDICHGKPVVRGMRWPVEVILDMLGAGMSSEEIVDDHPELEKEDIIACLKYARLSVSGQSFQFGNL